MLVVESNHRICLNLNNKKKMVKEVLIQEIEEGEISDDLEEMNQDCRVWMGGNMYGSGLNNFAWAQAVQNKPLRESLVREFELNNNRSTTTTTNSNVVVTYDDTNKVEEEKEKEEGELEEGEIELEDDLTDKRIKLICDTAVTVNEAEKSFDEVCTRLRTCLDSLGLIVLEDGASQVGDLIDKTFAAVNSVFKSNQHEQKQEGLSRLLDHVKSQVPALFSHEQMKEIQAAMDSLDSSSVMGMEIDNAETEVTPEVKNDLGISGEEGLLKPIVAKPKNLNNSAIESQKHGLVFGTGSKSRGSFSPLLDLHSDHDVDSLPSPTRKAPPPVYFQQQQTIGDVLVYKVETKNKDTPMNPYGPDDVTTVSTYQQKFGQSSLVLSSRLPSPTPSEENEGKDDGTNEEVSSLSTVGKCNPPISLQEIAAVPPNIDKSSGQQPLPAKTIGQVASGPNSRVALKPRDPRLRIVNPEIRPVLRDTPKIELVEGMSNLRKSKNVGDNLDNYALKKQKTGSAHWDASKDVHFGGLDNCNPVRIMVNDRTHPTTDPRISESRGVLSCDMQSRSNLNNNIGGTEQSPAVSTSTTPYFPSLLKDIAGNPTLLVQLIMEQQRLAAEAQRSRAPASNLNPAPGTTPILNVALSKSAEKPQATSTTWTAQGEWPNIRLKPRDPRRILFSSAFQNKGSLGAEKYGVLTSSSQANNDNLSVRQKSEGAQATSSLSQSSPAPDITRQFTKNLRNLADIVSSQSTNSVSTVAWNGSSQIIADKAEKVYAGVPITDLKDQQKGTTGTLTGVTETSRSQSNTWRDVEHLFGRYDDHQKAAIQRERIRRIGEQNRMFADKKLCLVLDLDHTLLNSAKFVEVEPAHEEILRKKEGQDREKPWRHLFRLPHMGMWTKLRPGIWTFLEEASKLYELHLYTMGNNSYATEMAKLLDPTRTLFAGRVISKGDDGDPLDGDEKIPKCKDLDGVLGMESAVVIMDDSVKVWPHNKLNLIAVERYTYFPCSRRQFGLQGPSLLEIDHDERPDEGTLASSLTVIERIHQNFFSNPSLHEVDVRNILASEQRKILAGCCILFSRIFPVGEAKPHQHPLWQTAEQFGAVCTTQIDNLVTHVVALSLGTDKVNWALSTGRYVVHPGWVEASALLYRRANEKDFAVKINVP